MAKNVVFLLSLDNALVVRNIEVNAVLARAARR
jgi:hypothetical protein